MEWLGFVFGMLTNAAILGVIVWAVVRLVGGRGDKAAGVDQAVSVRRLFVYGLLFVTLVLTSVGAVLVLQELAGSAFDDAEADRSALALGLAFVIVAGPAYGLLLPHARRSLGERVGERRSVAWAGYLNLSLLVSLIVATVATQQLLEGLTGVDDFEVASVAPVVVWGAVWASHWFWLVATYGLPGDWHLASGSLTGLVTLAIGAGGLVYVAVDEIYTRAVEHVPEGHVEPELRSWAIAALAGASVWSWYWLGRYVRADRTELWHVYVVLIGALGGLLATMGAAATIAYWTIVWFLGDPTETVASEHFEYVPSVAAAVLVVGAASWQYHRFVLQRRPSVERTEPLRTYDYLMAAAGLVAAVVGVTLALVALIETVTPEPAVTETMVANRVILAIVLSVIGVPLWWVFWSRIGRHAAGDPVAELGSMVRRIHLTGVFGVGGIVVLVSLINVLFVGLEDLLDGSVGGATVRSFRVGLSLLVTVTGVTWYHLGVFRSDRETLVRLKPVPPPPAPLPPLPTRHVVLIAPHGTTLAEDLTVATGALVDSWDRTDDTAMPEIDLEELTVRIDTCGPGHVLVLVDATGATVAPFEP